MELKRNIFSEGMPDESAFNCTLMELKHYYFYIFFLDGWKGSLF